MKPNDKAIEAAILAIKENGPYYAGSKIRESMAKHLAEVALPAAYAAQFQSGDYAGLVKELRERAGSYDSHDYHEEIELKAADALEALLAERDAAIEERADLAAHLAPEDEDALVDIAVETWVELTTGMARRSSAYTISERAGARAAIAAVRPHIEAAERDRLNGVIQEYQILLETQQRMFVDVQTERDALAARLDFWISKQ